MKVILLRDVARIGKKSDVVEVPDGHAINFLIPRKHAVIATGENLKRVLNEKDTRASQEQAQLKNFTDALERLKGVSIQYVADANEQGHLFKGIRADDVVATLGQHGLTISKQHVHLDAPIKEVGVHRISVTLGGVQGDIQLEVVKK